MRSTVCQLYGDRTQKDHIVNQCFVMFLVLSITDDADTEQELSRGRYSNRE